MTWHEGLPFELKSMGITDNFLKTIESLLPECHQEIVLNSQTCDQS